jgi:hypothetical protein
MALRSKSRGGRQVSPRPSFPYIYWGLHPIAAQAHLWKWTCLWGDYMIYLIQEENTPSDQVGVPRQFIRR